MATVACVPSEVADVGFSSTVRFVPLLSMYWPTTLVEVLSPLPVRVTFWPGLADASAALAGVPLVAGSA